MNNLESKMLIRVVKYRDNIIFGKYSDYTSALNDGTLLWESIIKDNNLSNTEKKLLLKEVKKAINLITDSIIMVKEREKAILEAKNTKGQPTVVVCSTVKGKGVSFMENNAGWHGNAPNKEQCEQALSEIGGEN